MKKYAPPAPDANLHRPGDIDYLRELLEAAGLSQRKAGPLLGMNERAMRYKISGESDLSYPEQYCLEVLADQRGTNMQTESNEGHAKPYTGVQAEPVEEWHKPAVWYEASERPIGLQDVGRIVVGEDRFGANVFGKLIRDGFGLVIRELGSQALDVHDVPVDRVAVYTLIDPRPQS